MEGDIRDRSILRDVFSQYQVDVIIHFAGLKAIGESVEHPLKYYENNVYGSVQLCTVMSEFGVNNIFFSSSETVFGDDYYTHDGTGVRGHIHVVDLAEAHLKTFEALKKKPGVLTVNLGTGVGCSVLDMVQAFKNASNVDVPYHIAPRRAGDVAACYADPSHAMAILGREAKLDLQVMCDDTWRWQSQNPDGYSRL